MNFTAEYQLTFEEFKELSQTLSQRYLQRAPRGKVVPTWIVTVLFIVGATGFSFFMTHNGKNSIRASDIVSGALPILGFIMLWGIGAYLQRWNVDKRYRRVWDASPFMHRPTTIHITDAGIMTSQLTAQQLYGWDHFIRFEETRAMFLLYISETFGLEIPKRIFDQKEIEDQVRELFRRHVTGMTHAFPVVPIDADENSRQEESND